HTEPHPVQRLSAVAGHRSGEVPVEHGKRSRARKAERQRAHDVVANFQRKKYPGTARSDIPRRTEGRVERADALGRVQVDRAPALDCFGVRAPSALERWLAE